MNVPGARVENDGDGQKGPALTKVCPLSLQRFSTTTHSPYIQGPLHMQNNFIV